MSFLLVSGLEPTIAHGSYDEEAVDIGSTDRAFDGSLRRSRLATKRECKFDVTPMTAATAHAWACLFRGLGEAWSFDASLYSANGMGPTGTPVYTLATAHPKFGAKNLSLNATTGTITYAAALGTSWTAMFWRYEGAAWVHYVITSAGTKWLDGVSNDAAVTTWFSVSGGSATIANTTGAAVEYDDLVLLPYLIPSTWPAVLGVAASAFSPLPRLYLTGDAIAEGGTRTVMGSASAKALGAMSGGSYSTALRTLSVVLQGV